MASQVNNQMETGKGSLEQAKEDQGQIG